MQWTFDLSLRLIVVAQRHDPYSSPGPGLPSLPIPTMNRDGRGTEA